MPHPPQGNAPGRRPQYALPAVAAAVAVLVAVALLALRANRAPCASALPDSSKG